MECFSHHDYLDSVRETALGVLEDSDISTPTEIQESYTAMSSPLPTETFTFSSKSLRDSCTSPASNPVRKTMTIGSNLVRKAMTSGSYTGCEFNHHSRRRDRTSFNYTVNGNVSDDETTFKAQFWVQEGVGSKTTSESSDKTMDTVLKCSDIEAAETSSLWETQTDDSGTEAVDQAKTLPLDIVTTQSSSLRAMSNWERVRKKTTQAMESAADLAEGIQSNDEEMVAPVEQSNERKSRGTVEGITSLDGVGSDCQPEGFGESRMCSSSYRGVSKHRMTGRYESHLWDKGAQRVNAGKAGRDKGKQVYLGGYLREVDAAEAYDQAALKFWGTEAKLNFPMKNYLDKIEEFSTMTNEEVVKYIRRHSSGFSRGASKFRGVTKHHQHGRWEARLGRVNGNKYMYLGTFASQEEAARAYDRAVIFYRGVNAVTNFDLAEYDIEEISANFEAPESNLSQSLKSSLIGSSARKRKARTSSTSLNFSASPSPPPTSKRTKEGPHTSQEPAATNFQNLPLKPDQVNSKPTSLSPPASPPDNPNGKSSIDWQGSFNTSSSPSSQPTTQETAKSTPVLQVPSSPLEEVILDDIQVPDSSAPRGIWFPNKPMASPPASVIPVVPQHFVTVPCNPFDSRPKNIPIEFSPETQSCTPHSNHLSPMTMANRARVTLGSDLGMYQENVVKHPYSQLVCYPYSQQVGYPDSQQAGYPYSQQAGMTCIDTEPQHIFFQEFQESTEEFLDESELFLLSDEDVEAMTEDLELDFPSGFGFLF